MSLDLIPLPAKRHRTAHSATRLRRRALAMRQGVAASLADSESLAFHHGQRVARGTVLAALDAALAEFTAADALVAQLKVQRLKIRKLLPRVVDVLEAVEGSLRTHYRPDAPALKHFGLKPRAPKRKLKPEDQLAANVRKTETRKIRRTLGKKQKAKLKAGPLSVQITVKK
jgi:hypothetical protein